MAASIRRQRAALREQALAMMQAGKSVREVARELGLPSGTVGRWSAEQNGGAAETKHPQPKRSGASGERRPPEAGAAAETLAEQKHAAAVLAAWARIEREEAEIVALLAGNAKLIAEKIRERVEAGVEVTAGARGGEQDISLRDLVGALEYTVKNWNLLRGNPTSRTEAKAEVTSRNALLDDPEYRDVLKRLFRLRQRAAAGPPVRG